jgi:hypothetical protein
MEPRLLVLNAFEPYKKSKKKDEQEVEDLVDEFKKLNTTISIIPRGCTSYVQLLDVLVNKIIKDIIWQCEEDHYDAYAKDLDKGKYSPRDRRVLLHIGLLKHRTSFIRSTKILSLIPLRMLVYL